MNLTSLFSVDHILDDMQATEHFNALEELVDHLAGGNFLEGLPKQSVMEAIRNRENQTSTGIGSGVAIPHAFVPGLKSVTTVFGRSHKGIDFEAIDHVPVNLVVLFIVPEDQYHTHLETLAAIAKMLNDGETRARLIDAPDAEAILSIIQESFSA